MRPRSHPLVTSSLASVILLLAMRAGPAHASGASDYFRAGRQAWLEKDWGLAIRQFSLALAESLPASRRGDALFYRADALARVHDCGRAAADVSALRALGAPTSADRDSELERILADCEQDSAGVVAVARTLPLQVRLYGGTHQYGSRSSWRRTLGAELSFVPGALQGFVRGGWIGTKDYAGELGLRVVASSSLRFRPWLEGAAGLERLRTRGGFTFTFSIPEWDSITTTFGRTSPEPTFHGTSVGLGAGLDVGIHASLGVGAACRWRHVHWKSDLPASLPSDDREIVAYLFAR